MREIFLFCFHPFKKIEFDDRYKGKIRTIFLSNDKWIHSLNEMSNKLSKFRVLKIIGPKERKNMCKMIYLLM